MLNALADAEQGPTIEPENLGRKRIAMGVTPANPIKNPIVTVAESTSRPIGRDNAKADRAERSGDAKARNDGRGFASTYNGMSAITNIASVLPGVRLLRSLFNDDPRNTPDLTRKW